MTESPTKAITTIADLLRGVRVELCGRTATILGFIGAERFHELRVLVDATGEEESWWVGNLTKVDQYRCDSHSWRYTWFLLSEKLKRDDPLTLAESRWLAWELPTLIATSSPT